MDSMWIWGACFVVFSTPSMSRKRMGRRGGWWVHVIILLCSFTNVWDSDLRCALCRCDTVNYYKVYP